MIFPNTPANSNLTATHLPQFFNSAAISLPFNYNGTQINYRDSSWLKLNVCELYLKSECPNIDNCSLAHPPSTVKIENNNVTVCYDYIKKKDCKHGNCKYYHPHDALASAILRRGDDSKKNGNALNNMALNIGMRNPLQINRSHEIINIPNHNLLSSQINAAAAAGLMSDSQIKSKLEVMRQLNTVNAAAASAWLPGLNVATAQTLANPATNQANVSLHTLLPGVSAKNSMLNQLGLIVSTSPGCSAVKPIVGGYVTDTKVSGKRVATEAFGPNSSSGSSNMIHASSDNNSYVGMSEIKKLKHEETENTVDNKIDMGLGLESVSSVSYVMPHMINSTSQHLQSSTPLTMTGLTGTNINNVYNLLHSTPMQTSAITPYSQISPLALNNLMIQSLLTSNSNMANNHHGLDAALLGLSAQKIYPMASAYPQVNIAQLNLLNQLYYQQLYQNSLTNQTQMLYPGTINIAELQQRSFEETSVAFINDKGTILETLPVCKDFLQGKCKRNQSCNYVHLLDSNVEVKDNKLTVCKNALKGQCHRPVCKFYHIPSYQLQKLGFSA